MNQHLVFVMASGVLGVILRRVCFAWTFGHVWISQERSRVSVVWTWDKPVLIKESFLCLFIYIFIFLNLFSPPKRLTIHFFLTAYSLKQETKTRPITETNKPVIRHTVNKRITKTVWKGDFCGKKKKDVNKRIRFSDDVTVLAQRRQDSGKCWIAQPQETLCFGFF